MRSGFLGAGIGPTPIARKRAITDWWLAAGTIALANVLERVENPAARQAYAGAAATGAWSVSLRTNLASLPSAGVTVDAFDSESGRVILYVVGGGVNGFFPAGSVGLFTTGDHTYMLVSDGANIQAYRDNAAIGSASSSAANIGGTTRWRSRYVDSAGDWSDWPVAIRAGHVANIALDATQRAALHTAMMALA